jgi:GNAT superfamily N-acetyltransferase
MPAAIRRTRSAADFQELHELLVAYEADLPPVLRHGWVPGAGELERLYRERSAAFLADSDGYAIGCVAVTELDAHNGVIMRLFVRPESRGAGTARALVLRALEFSHEAGYSRVVLDTDKDRLPAAYRLYQSLGFSECGPYTSVTYPRPTFMERRIE